MARSSDGPALSSLLLLGGVAYLAYVVLKGNASADTPKGAGSSSSGGGSNASLNSLLAAFESAQTPPPPSPSSPGHSGATIAADGQTLASQSPVVQKLFKDTYGGNAAIVWVQQHNAAIGA